MSGKNTHGMRCDAQQVRERAAVQTKEALRLPGQEQAVNRVLVCESGGKMIWSVFDLIRWQALQSGFGAQGHGMQDKRRED